MGAQIDSTRGVWMRNLRRFARPLLLLVFAVPAVAFATSNGAQLAAQGEGASQSAAIKVLGDYVQIVGGVVAVLGAVFGAPLTYQTYQKTRAEIRKINLEARKFETELAKQTGEPVQAGLHGDEGLNISFEGGENNVVNISADPRFAIPLLLLVDALIAYFYYRVCSFALDLSPLPGIIMTPLYLVLFLVIFLPLFRTARQVKQALARDWHLAADRSGETPSGKTEDAH